VSHVTVNVLEIAGVSFGISWYAMAAMACNHQAKKWPVIGATDEGKNCRSKNRSLFEPTKIVS
jgi:uncharacterized membrane protein